MAGAAAVRGLPAVFLLLAAASSLCPCVAASGDEEFDHTSAFVTDLGVGSFDEYVKEKRESQRPCLVMFHVNWCKVCQKTFPKYSKGSEVVIEKGIPMDFAHVDCTNDKTLCQRFGVKGYPTIKFFPPKEGAEPSNFRGQRSEQGFLKYAERMTLPALRPFADAAQLDKALRNETLSGVVVAAGAESGAGLREAAERWRDRHIFAVAPGADLRELLPEALARSAPAGATLAILSVGAQQWRGANKHAESKPAALYYHGGLDDFEALDQWVETNRFPGIWALDEGNFYEFTHANRSAVLVAVDPASVSKTQEEVLRGDAAKLVDDFFFGIVDGVAWSEELKDFHVATQDLPRILVSENNFEAWVEDIEEIKLDTMEHDLRALLAGAPLLRQGRTVMARLLYNKREAWRFGKRVQSFAEEGQWQTALVCLGVAAALGAVMVLGWCVSACCGMVFAEEDDDFAYAAAKARAEARMKKD